MNIKIKLDILLNNKVPCANKIIKYLTISISGSGHKNEHKNWTWDFLLNNKVVLLGNRVELLPTICLNILQYCLRTCNEISWEYNVIKLKWEIKWKIELQYSILKNSVQSWVFFSNQQYLTCWPNCKADLILA
jgi:hypothetical protein